MPYETQTTPFTGDNDLEDFLTNVYVPFARDDVKWTDNLAPVRDPVVSNPEAEVYICRQARSGSPLAPTTSPTTTLPPYLFLRTSANGKHLMHFTGTGIAAEISPLVAAYDQPDNPMSHPPDANYTIADSAQLSALRCLITNELQGTFDKYWLFAPDDGTYIHCVIKVTTRQYRHFHVGLLTPLHPDLDDTAFYVTSHFWEQLDPTALSSQQSSSSPPTDGEHDPYSTFHRMPFWGCQLGNETDGPGIQRMQFGTGWLHMPGLAQNSPEIIWYKPMAGDALTFQDFASVAVRASVGNVNKGTDDVIFGIAHMSGSPDGLGANLFRADRTFTSNAVPLIPMYVGANIDFAGDVRQGVVAQFPDVFRINMANLAAEDEITVGSDIYTVFPLINDDSVNVLTGEGYSAFEGLAYKKIDNGPVP